MAGFPLGYLFASGHFSMTTLLLIMLGLALIPLYMYRLSRVEGFEFWNLAGTMPEEAYAWFKSEEGWYLEEHQPTTKSSKIDGPFRLMVPSLDRTIRVWADAQKMLDSQRRFIRKYEPRKGDPSASNLG